MNRFVVLSGCSGGGKSSLLAELAKRGFGTLEEPGRRIVVQQQRTGGSALPWIDTEAFLKLAVKMSLRDLKTASVNSSWTFFDRGLIDAASALAQVTDTAIAGYLGSHQPDYHRQVFVTPPWPEIYAMDDQRQHPLSAALGEYNRLLVDYPKLGYDVTIIPKMSVAARADFVLCQLSL